MSIRFPSAVAALMALSVPMMAGCGPEGLDDPGGAPDEVRGTVQLPVGACTVNFEATVRRGPSAGTALEGYAVFQADATGALHDSAMHTVDGQTVPVTGRVAGRDVTLRFDLGGGRVIEGTGTLTSSLRECTGEMRGPLTGPLPGDAGDWLGGDGAVALVTAAGQVNLAAPAPASASSPQQGGTAMTPAGVLFVSNPARHVILRASDAFAPLTVWAGALDQRGNVDGTRASARFNGPTGLAYDPVRNALFIADTGNHQVRRIPLGTNAVTTPLRVANVSAASVALGYPALSQFATRGVGVTTDGTLYVSDASNHCVWRVHGGTFQASLLAGRPTVPGRLDGVGANARFTAPAQVVGGTNVVQVAEPAACAVRTIELPAGRVTTLGVANCE